MRPLSAELLEKLHKVVGRNHAKTDADALAHYGRDTCDMFAGRPGAVVLPASTSEVQRVVRLANELGLAIVPSGGRTGLSGGATATNGEIVLSLERMDRILGSNITDRTVRCQAGVVIARLQQQAEDMGLHYPVDYAASGSSQVGGNIATNAGGNRVIRYGMTRDCVAALQVVTGAGEVLELGRGLHKDNTGYDLRQLFIGSEGTLGVITEATMRLAMPPAESSVMVLGLQEAEHLIDVLETFRSTVTLNAFEFFSEQALEKVVRRHGLARPFDPPAPIYALIDYETASEGDRQAALQAYEDCRARDWVGEGTVSQSGRQAAELWRLRDDISETLSHWSPYKHDVSIPVSRVPEFLRRIGDLVARRYADFEVVSYGHIGDGNVHINILKPAELAVDQFRQHCGVVSAEIFALLEQFGGSVSAEHGVGLLKKPYLRYTRSEAETALMRTIRKVLDPQGIMNPGKIFD